MEKYQLLLLSFCCILLIGCSEEKPNNSKSHTTPIKVIYTTSNLSTNIDRAIQDAELTYKKIANFRDALFKDGLYQGQSILCSIHRLVKLKSKKTTFDKEPKKIFKKNNFIQYTYAKESYNKGYTYSISIPSSKQYTSSELTIHTCCYDGYTYNHHELSASRTNQRYNHTNNHNMCEAYYLKPIPNSNGAKKIEITNFARIIVTSLRRNKMHQERLPILETQLSTILSFESTLKKMKKDLAFDMLDPLNTEAKIKEYDTFFNKSLQSLGYAN